MEFMILCSERCIIAFYVICRSLSLTLIHSHTKAIHLSYKCHTSLSLSLSRSLSLSVSLYAHIISLNSHTNTNTQQQQQDVQPGAAAEQKKQIEEEEEEIEKESEQIVEDPIVAVKKLLLSAFQEASSGLVGAIFSSLCVYPMDFVKTRMQVPGSKYTGVLQAFQKIAVEEGPLTLYKGLTSEIIKGSMQNFTYYAWYTIFKDSVRRFRFRQAHPEWPAGKRIPEEKLERVMPPGVSLAVGFVCGCITQLFITPLSVVQTRIMTMPPEQKSGIIRTFYRVVREDGFSALFRGIGPSLLLSSNPAIQFFVFDRLKAMMQKFLEKRAVSQGKKAEEARSLSAPELFLFGAIAKIAATIVTYPYIMAKIRLQWKGDKSKGDPTYYSAWHVITHTFKKEGFFGLYQGLRPQLLKSVLGAALMFMAKEKCTQLSAKGMAVLSDLIDGVNKKVIK